MSEIIEHRSSKGGFESHSVGGTPIQHPDWDTRMAALGCPAEVRSRVIAGQRKTLDAVMGAASRTNKLKQLDADYARQQRAHKLGMEILKAGK
jgi:hypothetical protein